MHDGSSTAISMAVVRLAGSIKATHHRMAFPYSTNAGYPGDSLNQTPSTELSSAWGAILSRSGSLGAAIPKILVPTLMMAILFLPPLQPDNKWPRLGKVMSSIAELQRPVSYTCLVRKDETQIFKSGKVDNITI